jgi:hypothetical protein
MLFNKLGRRIPSKKCRVFRAAENDYYKLESFDYQYSDQHQLATDLGFLGRSVPYRSIEAVHRDIFSWIRNDENWANLESSVYIPFSISMPHLLGDEGEQLNQQLLPIIESEFKKRGKGQFKATLQGSSSLESEFTISATSYYEKFVADARDKVVVGIYFPCAFQEYDIASQRSQISRLGKNERFNYCLSGHLEMSYSLALFPNLLYSPNHYSPILCVSPLIHSDKRMIPVFKSYGPHLEFWLMSQMMTPEVTQVSEQWAGGLTIYATLD